VLRREAVIAENRKRGAGVELTNEYVHEYEGWAGPNGECVIRTFEAEGEPPVVVCSAVRGNLATSISNICEHLAAEIVEKHYPRLLPRSPGADRRAVEDPPFWWVVHYPAAYRSRQEQERAARGGYVSPLRGAESWFDVAFESYRVDRRGRPRLGFMRPGGETTRERVEDLVGNAIG
jgi:hypothetical protein